MLSIVIPTHNSEAKLPRCLAALVPGVMSGLVKEAIVADAGSADDTLAIAEAAGCEIVAARSGRARQLIDGANTARGKWLLFLHPDTALAPGWVETCERFINAGGRARAAAFRLVFEDASPQAKRVQFITHLRGRMLKLPSGDQGLLISRVLYDALGGYSELDMMEDVDLVRRIGFQRLTLLDSDAITTADNVRHAWRNLGLTARYLLGADPKDLAKSLN